MNLSVTLRSSNLAATLPRRLGDAATRAAYAVRDEAKQRMVRGPQTGRVYRKAGGRVHQASAPGQAPAVDTGRGVRGVHVEARGRGEARVIVPSHLAALELRRNRPFLAPAVQSARKQFAEDLRVAFRV